MSAQRASYLAAELYELHAEKVRRHLTRALGDRHAAEDVTQQVFLKVVAALPGFEQRGVPVEAWLFRIVGNCVVDHARRNGQLEVEDPFVLARRLERQAGGVRSELSARLAAAGFEEMVSSLPPLQRQVLILRYQLDLSNSKIAAVLGRSHGAIRQAHYAAIRSLEARVVVSRPDKSGSPRVLTDEGSPAGERAMPARAKVA